MKKILSILVILLLVMQSFCFAQTSETLPNVNCGVYYDEANQQFNAFMHVTKNGYEKNALLFITAHKNKVLADLKSVSLTELEDVDSVFATVDYDGELSFKDYSFKFFMFDEDLKPLKIFPEFTIQDPPPSDEVQPSIRVSGVIVENTTTALDGTKAIDTSKPARVKVKLCDTYGSTHSAFREYSDWTASDFESANIVFEFLVGDSSAESFLGKRVDLGLDYKEDTDEFVINDNVQNSSNNVTSFEVGQFSDISISGTKTTIGYYQNISDRDATELTVEADASVVYNNVGGYDLDDIFGSVVVPDCVFGGTVTLIDNDLINGYDVVLVEIGSTAVVDHVNGTRVYFKEAAELAKGGSLGGISVDAAATDEKFVFLKDGKEISISELKEWDVLNIIAAEKTADYIVAEVSGTTVTGTVSSTPYSNTSATGLKYTINDNKYDVAYGNYQADNLQIGDTGIFYIDKYGKIAAFIDTTVPNYGFVLYAAKKVGGVDASYVQIRMITANGVENFDFADKVKYYKTATPTVVDGDAAALLTDVMTNRYELVKYETNASGKINAFYEAGYDIDKFKKKGEYSAAYDSDNFRLGTVLDPDAKVFLLSTSIYDADDLTAGIQNPTEAEISANLNLMPIGGYYYKIKASNCCMGTLADLNDEEPYTAKVYLDSKGDDGNLVVITSGYGRTAEVSSLAVITEAAPVENENFEECYLLSYYIDGELVEGVYTTHEAAIAGLTAGDIVKIHVNKKGVITAIDFLMDFGNPVRNASTGKVNAISRAADGVKDNYAFGYATAYSRNTHTATVEGFSYRLASAKNVYIIDGSLKVGKIDVGAAGDFTWDMNVISASDREKYADYLFIREYAGKVEDVVIIKNIIDYEDPDNGIILDTEASMAAEEADIAYEDFLFAKANYEAAKAAYDADMAEFGVADDFTVNNAIDYVKETANYAYAAAYEACAMGAEYDLTAASSARAYADALVYVE